MKKIIVLISLVIIGAFCCSFSYGRIDSRILIDKLDKSKDEEIGYLYKQSPDNIKVYSITKGFYTNAKDPELLVIFKLPNLSHVSGLDCSVAAIYNEKNLNLISQKMFRYDNCKFSVLKDNAGRGFLLLIGSSMYQGIDYYELALWDMEGSWKLLYPSDSQYYNENKKFIIKGDGKISVYYHDGNYMQSKVREQHQYDLAWNKSKHTLDKVIPSSYKDKSGRVNIYTVAKSPDGAYAISAIPDDHKVLIYNTIKNTPPRIFDLLAQDYDFLWSRDSKKVCVVMAARVWKESCIIDIKRNIIINLPSMSEIINRFKDNGEKFNYTPNENRPDVYITPLEWSSDSSRVLFFYQLTDSEYKRQSGTFIMRVNDKALSKLLQNIPELEGGNLSPKSPVNFSW